MAHRPTPLKTPAYVHLSDVEIKSFSLKSIILSCASCWCVLDHLCGLPPSTNDPLSRSITANLALGFQLRSSPDINFTTTSDDTNSHGREQVVSSVAVHIHTAVEHSCSVFANTRSNHGLATRVVLDEISHIVDNTGDGNETTAILALVNIVIPFHNRKLLQRNTPVELGTLLIQFLLQLLQTALLDFIAAELLQIIRKTELFASPDEPLGGVILVPFDSVAVVRGEFVVEVVISLTKSDQGSDDVVTRGVAVIERLVSKPVSERVDTEGGLLDEEDSEDTSVDEATEVIAPANASNDGGENQAHEEDDLEVVLVLPDNDWVFIQIGDVGTSNSLGVLLHDHPTYVRIEQTLADRVWILLGIGISVMCSVVTSPPSDRTFNGTTSHGSEEYPQGQSGGE